MDDLQKLSVYMNYYIDGLTSLRMINITHMPINFNAIEFLRLFKQRGIMLFDRTETGTPINKIESVTFDEFKEKYLNDYYEQYKNEIKLA